MMFAKLLRGLVYGALVVLSITAAKPTLAASVPVGCRPNPKNNAFADVDGDGKAEAIVVNQSGITIMLLGNSVPVSSQWTNAYYGTRGTFFADVTGPESDGRHRADAIVVNEWGITVRRSNGSSFLPNELWTKAALSDPFYGEVGTYFADVTGDGKVDAIAIDRNKIRVRVSDGRQFLPSATTVWGNGTYFGVYGTYFADVFGPRADGVSIARLITVNSNDISATVANYFGSYGYFLPFGAMTTGAYWGDIGTYFADVDGDGKADAIVDNLNHDGNVGIVVRYSDGYIFKQIDWSLWPTSKFYGTAGTYFADVTGDRKADAIAIDRPETGNPSKPGYVRVRNSSGSGFYNERTVFIGDFTSDLQPIC